MLVLAVAGSGTSAPATAQQTTPSTLGSASPAQVEAAYLLKFPSYVEWPKSAFAKPDSPIRIGILGDDAVARALEQMPRNRTVQGRSIAMRRLAADEPLDGLHILFLGRLSARDTQTALGAVEGLPVLTVSNSSEVHARGTMINLKRVDERLRFEVYLPPVERGRLRLSALMLTVAHRIRRSER